MGLGGQSKHSLGQDNVAQLQAMRDLVTPATLAFERKGDLEALGKEKQSWRDVALAFWQSTVRDDEETRAKIRQRKLHRTKAYEWLLAVSHMVLIATGSQLARNQQVEDKAARKDPAAWPCATVCIDQGFGQLAIGLSICDTTSSYCTTGATACGTTSSWLLLTWAGATPFSSVLSCSTWTTGQGQVTSGSQRWSLAQRST